uniref:Nuclear pore complex protein NUP214 n=1 Tax=Chenopodium quinoa TaxID=63459 RepID=A0A803LXZ4_CHEQI
MAVISDYSSSKKTLQVEEQVEGERIETNDYFFCKIGDSIPIMSDGSIFDANNPPAKPLVISESSGLIFAAHSTGFCVANITDVIAAAKEIKDKGSGPSVQDLCVVDVLIGRVSILALSTECSVISAVVEGEIQFFFVDSLLNMDKKPTFCSSVESNPVKDMFWINETDPSFIVLTSGGKVFNGAINKSLKHVMDEVDAVGRSVDGNFVAVGRKKYLTIYSSKLEEILQVLLPTDTWTDKSDTIKVDSIKWVRSDSIVVGCFQQTEDGKEENYFVQVITSKAGKIIDACDQSLLLTYLSVNFKVHYFCATENGDENLVLGLCADKSSVYENVKVKIGVEEERELPPHCLLVCLTLEGKLVMYNVASIAGSQRSSQDLSVASSDAQSISVVEPSNVSKAPFQSEEERSKQSVFDLGLCESDKKKISSALDVPVSKVQELPEQKAYTLGITNFDQNTRKELISGSNHQKEVADVNNSKSFGQLGQAEEGNSNQSPFKSLHGLGSAAGNTVVTENWKTEYGELNRTLTPPTSGSFLGGSGVLNSRSLFSPQSFDKSTVSGSPFTSTNIANSSESLFRNSGSRPSDSFVSSTKGVDHSQKSITSSGMSGLPSNIPGSKMLLQESGKLQNLTGQSVPPMFGNDRKSSPLGQLNSEQNLPKQFSNVQNMAKELDKLLKSIEEEGGFKDICTAAHRNSLKILEEGMNGLSERNRVWQNHTEEQHREIQLLLDKTVQVLARKTHMEGVVRQTTDGQYWDLWNRQKLNSELDQKRLNVLNRSQDLTNRMIELERHFNNLELNLFGKSSGENLVSRALNSRSASSRHNQSLHAIHNAAISQLAAANQLSDSLSKQMAVLSIKSPPTKQATVKQQVFESIGIPYPDGPLRSPSTVKVMNSPSNRHPLVLCSGETRNDSKRIQLTGVSNPEPETARRRRDSLDRNWANFEVAKTTVKRMVVQNERQKVGGLFSSMDKQFASPGKMEGSVANHSKVLSVQDRNGRNDTSQKLSADTAAVSKFKWTGSIPGLSEAETEQPLRWQFNQGDSIKATQNISSSSSLLSPFVDPNSNKGNIHSTAERPGCQIGSIDRSGTSAADTVPSLLQFGKEESLIQKNHSQPFSFSIKGGEIPTFGKKETETTKPVGDQSFVSTSKQDVGASPSSVFPPVNFSSIPNLSMQTLPTTSVVRSTTNTEMAKDNKEGLQFSSSAFSVSSSLAASSSSSTSSHFKEVSRFPTSPISVSTPQEAPVISPSSKSTEVVDSDSTGPSMNLADKLSKVGPQVAAKKESAANNLAATPQSPEKLASTTSGSSNFLNLMPSVTSAEVPKALASSPDMNKIATHVSNMVSNTPEKQSAAVTPSPTSPEVGGTAGGKSDIDATVAQEDEMEEVAPETNQTAELSLGSLAGFGLGSAPNATTPKSNPFGGPITSAPQTMSSSISLNVPSGELFRPASFSFQSLQASQPSQSSNTGASFGAFGFANPLQQVSSGSGFGQPSQIGSGQQALGSVLGSFGQSRQLGAGLPGSGFGIPQSPAGGFQNTATVGGFAGISSVASGFGGGFANAATIGGGFAAAAPSGGGFAAAAPSGGGFAAAAPSGGGFAAAAPSGGGFAGAAGGAGGFGAFGKPVNTGFSAFGSSVGGRPAPPELFTQMRK